MKGGITYASCKESGGETSSQKSGACKEGDSKEGSGEEGGEKGCLSGEKDRCQEIGHQVFATVVRINRRRLISPPIFLGIKTEFIRMQALFHFARGGPCPLDAGFLAFAPSLDVQR